MEHAQKGFQKPLTQPHLLVMGVLLSTGEELQKRGDVSAKSL